MKYNIRLARFFEEFQKKGPQNAFIEFNKLLVLMREIFVYFRKRAGGRGGHSKCGRVKREA